MDTKLLDMLARLTCKGPLMHEARHQPLVCRADRICYPIRDGIAITLREEIIPLPENDPI